MILYLDFYSGSSTVQSNFSFIITEEKDKARFSEITLAVPGKYSTGQIGGFKGNALGKYLLQYAYDKYLVSDINNPRAYCEKGDGKFAPGWVKAGKTAVFIEDFKENFEIIAPENFNFAYDVVDAWAAQAPDKLAMLWTNDEGKEMSFTFADIKRESDRVASFFLQLGIKRGDCVMMMLKRRVEFWFTIVALHKIGAVAIPATHLLTPKDLIYRNNSAGIRMIVAADDPLLIQHVNDCLSQSPTVEFLVATGSYKEGNWYSMDEGRESAPEFVKPESVNTNSDISLLYFTSGSSGQPKMVAHNFLYPLGHIVTAKYWHNVHENSLHLTVADTGWGKAVWGKLYGQWIVGAAVFVYDHEKFTPADILAVMAKHKVTSFCAPPTIYRFLIREDLSKYDLSALEYCTTAGEPLNPSVFDAWKEAV